MWARTGVEEYDFFFVLRAVKAAINEPGLFIGAIRKELGVGQYKGNASMTEKKILRDVFKVNYCYLLILLTVFLSMVIRNCRTFLLCLLCEGINQLKRSNMSDARLDKLLNANLEAFFDKQLN